MIIQSLASSDIFNTIGILSGLILLAYCSYMLVRRKERRTNISVVGWYLTPREVKRFYARKR